MFPVRKRGSNRKKCADALEKGEASPVQPAPPPGGLAEKMAAAHPGGVAASMAAGGIIKLAAGVADMRPKVINRQMSTASFDMNSRQYEQTMYLCEKVLTPEEKRFILLVERGDCASVDKLIKMYRNKPKVFDVNCLDPLGRNGLSIAIINENPEMMDLLLTEGIQVKDALLLAISEEYVEGVELLLSDEEKNHETGQPYSWESVDPISANYTPDITPLILAAHYNNYEILKILLDRGATLPTPHDLKCSCDSCLTSSQEDSLRFSLSRINAYKALASPSLIALTSSDPILTAFQLSDELKKLRNMETQFCSEYNELRKQVKLFANSLLDHARTSYELEIMLNYDQSGDIWDPGETQTLERLKLALHCRQKAFVAHPNVQQLLASIWYEGLPGWRRWNIFQQAFELMKIGLMFPFLCITYMIAPNSQRGIFLKNPFVKFVCHSASFLCFLALCAGASQRVEKLILQLCADSFPEFTWLRETVRTWNRHERGSLPSPLEWIIFVWVLALMWKEMKIVYDVGIMGYLCDLWNLADCFTNMCFTGWIFLRMTAYVLVLREEAAGRDPHIPREEWHAYDPYLISEGLFGAGMISSYLKLVHIFSINPQLGPLQISLGRMTEDIFKFGVLYCLVLFAFGCGMNQLLWYYADLEYEKCYGEGDIPDPQYATTACVVWRRFANMFETAQSLFWASFGLVPLTDFELTGIKEFTRFWALLMFGSYSVCNIIVLLNMLIAMMSNSYQTIAQQADTEWKFARTKLWISYFDNGATVPPPFNIFPTPKSVMKLCGCKKQTKKEEEDQNTKDKQHREISTKRYNDVMKCIIRRYITAEQKKTEDFSITEDDVAEIRQDINKFRYEMIEILRNNNFATPNDKNDSMFKNNKRAKQKERRILKGFNLTTSDVIKEAFANQPDGDKPTDFFAVIAKAIGKKSPAFGKKGTEAASDSSEPAKFEFKNFEGRKLGSFKRKLSKSVEEDLTSEELVQYNPNLAKYTPTTRFAYAKFKTRLESKKLKKKIEDDQKKIEEDQEVKKTVSGSSTCFTIVDDEEKVEDTKNKTNDHTGHEGATTSCNNGIQIINDCMKGTKVTNADVGQYSLTLSSQSKEPSKQNTFDRDRKESLNCLVSQNDVPYSLSGSVLDSTTDIVLENSQLDQRYTVAPNYSSTLVVAAKGDSSFTHHPINTITSSPFNEERERISFASSDKRTKTGKSPSPPLLPPRGVIRSSSSTSSRICELQGTSYANKNRSLSQQDSKDSTSYSSSIPFADEEGRHLKECLLSSATYSRETEALREQDTVRNMIVHNRSRENHSSLENVSVDTNGSGKNRPVATIVPHNCIGSCDPDTRGQMKTGWL